MIPMLATVYRLSLLAQALPWDEPAPAPPQTPAPRPMSFSDLKAGLRAYNTGETDDSTFRNGILILIAVVALIALIVHLKQRSKSAGPPDSLWRLGWDVGKLVRFPLGARLVLWWVARSSRVPFTSLLLSSKLFDSCVQAWAEKPTFAIARHWGRARLLKLRESLFDPPPAALPSGPAEIPAH